MLKKNSSIIVIINNSWGSIDWVLPILFRFKEKYNANILIVIKDKIFYDKYFYQDLFKGLTDIGKLITPDTILRDYKISKKKLFKKLVFRKKGERNYLNTKYISCLIRLLFTNKRDMPVKYLPTSLITKIISTNLGSKSPNIIFHDDSGSLFLRLTRAFNDSQTIMVPHGTIWYEQEFIERIGEFGKENYALPENALVLTGVKEDLEFYNKMGVSSKIIYCSHPKFYKEWLKLIKQRALAERDNEKLTILFIAMPKSKVSSSSKFESLLTDIIAVVNENDASLVIRRHPRQSQNELEEIFANKLSGKSIIWSNNSVLMEAFRADLVISFPSSAVMDAVAAGVPTIEYFDYSNESFTTFLREENYTTSIYRKKFLVAEANNYEELSCLVKKLLSDEKYREKIKNSQQKAINNVLNMGGEINLGDLSDKIMENCV